MGGVRSKLDRKNLKTKPPFPAIPSLNVAAVVLTYFAH